MKKYIFCW